MINIISAYAPQVGEKEVNKEGFTKDLKCMINNIPEGEKVIIGADLNAHLGEGGEGYRRIHGGEGYGKRNAEGQKALKSLEGLDMAVVNTFFKKREKQKITYKSGPGQSQIDFIVTRREDLNMFSDCKVIAGEEVVHQHRLVCGVVKVKECKKKRKRAEKGFEHGNERVMWEESLRTKSIGSTEHTRTDSKRKVDRSQRSID